MKEIKGSEATGLKKCQQLILAGAQGAMRNGSCKRQNRKCQQEPPMEGLCVPLLYFKK